MTSSVLDPAEYPLFADSAAAAAWIRPFASPFDPHDGRLVPVGGRRPTPAYKRLLKPFSIPAGGGDVQALDVVRPRARLRLHVRRDPHGGPGRLDDAGRRERPHLGRLGPVLPVRRATARTGSRTTRSSPTTRRRPPTATTATRPARAAAGTPRPATPAAGRSGRCRSRRPTTGKNVEISVSVASDPAVLGPRRLGRRAAARVDSRGRPDQLGRPVVRVRHGRLDHCPARPRPPARAGSRPRPAGSGRRAPRSSRRRSRRPTTPSTRASASRRSTGAANRAALMGAALSHLGAPSKPVLLARSRRR